MTEKGNYEIKYADKLRNCEDLVVDDQAGYVVIGCDEGRDVWNTVMVVPPTHSSPSKPILIPKLTGHLWQNTTQKRRTLPLRLFPSNPLPRNDPPP